MTLRRNNKKALLAQAVLASTVFCLFPSTTASAACAGSGGGALTNIATNDTASVPSTTGYNIINTLNTMDVDTTASFGCSTISGTPVAIDNNNGNPGCGAACTNSITFSATNTVQGVIGYTNPIEEIETLNSGITVTFQNNVFLGNNQVALTTPGLIFGNNNDTFSLGDGITVNGQVDNPGNNTGDVLQFQGGGSLTNGPGSNADIGASNTVTPSILLQLNTTGLSNRTIEIQGNTINVSSTEVSGVGGTTLNLAPPLGGLTVQSPGGILTVNNGIDTLEISATGNTTITTPQLGSATNAFGTFDVGNGNVTFSGSIFATTTVFQGNNTLTLTLDPVVITGGVNTNTNNTGMLVFDGNGRITGPVGSNGNSLVSITANMVNLDASATLEFDGNPVSAQTITIGDNGVAGSTILLNNAAMVLTGNLMAQTAGVDFVNAFNVATINGNIGTSAIPFSFMRVAANGPTTINGNIFVSNAAGVQFNGNNSLTLGNNDTITGTVTTINPNTGILQFNGTGKITGNVGTNALQLNTINFLAPGTVI